MTGALPLDDRVELRAVLGRGAMGEVHRAWDRVLERAVAVKFLRGSDPREAERILLEARLQARVDHLHVVRVHEAGTLGGRPCLVLQLVEGRTLAELGPELPVAERVELLRQAAEGLHAAHREGLVHRDVKPENVLVEEGPPRRALVSDFGLARGDEGGLTRSGVPAGTLEYMSPEQLLGPGPADFRSDLYALGASLHALLAGRPPFRHGDGGATAEGSLLRRILEEAPDPLPREIPVELRRVTAKAMEKDPAARYASAQAFADDLARFQRGEPVLARPAPASERALRWTRRNRVATRALAAALVALLAALGFGLWQSRRSGIEALQAARMGALASSLEARLDLEHLAPLHDLRPALAALRPEVEQLRARSARGPAAGPASYALGKGLELLGELPEAREAYQRALALGFGGPQVDEGLGEVLARLYARERDRALQTLGPGARGERLAALERELRDPALRHLAQGAADAGRSLSLQARIALLEGDLETARTKAAEVLRVAPQRYQARRLQGEAWLAEATRRGDADDLPGVLDALRRGEEVLVAAAEWGRSDPELLLLLARLHVRRAEAVLRQGRDAGAVVASAQAWLDRAAQLDPDAPALLVAQAGLLMDSERLAANYGRESGLPRLRRAVDLLRRASALEPAEVATRAQLLRALYRVGHFLLEQGEPCDEPLDEGIAVQAAAVALAPTDPELREVGAALLLEKGRARVEAGQDGAGVLRRAVEEADLALRLDTPAPGKVRRTLSEALVFSGRAEWLAGADPRPALARSALEAEALYGGAAGSFIGGYQAVFVLAQASLTLLDLGDDPRALVARALEVVEATGAAHPDQPLVPFLGGQLRFIEARRRSLVGEDPRPALAEARRLISEAARRIGNPAVAEESLAILSLAEARARVDRGQDPSAALAAAEVGFRRVARQSAIKVNGPLGLAGCALERARWLSRRGGPAGTAAAAAARQGLAPAEEAMRRSGLEPHPRILRARLQGFAGDAAGGRATLAAALAANALVGGSLEARAARAELALP